MKKYIDRGLIVIMVVLVVGALLGSVYMLSATLRLEQTVVQSYYWNDEWYTCKHTPGEMECWLSTDEDVGFGKEE